MNSYSLTVTTDRTRKWTAWQTLNFPSPCLLLSLLESGPLSDLPWPCYPIVINEYTGTYRKFFWKDTLGWQTLLSTFLVFSSFAFFLLETGKTSGDTASTLPSSEKSYTAWLEKKKDRKCLVPWWYWEPVILALNCLPQNFLLHKKNNHP